MLFDVQSVSGERKWVEIPLAGYKTPIPSVVFRGSDKPCCGVPLGGIGTGCVDIDAAGAWGFNSMFNGYTHREDTMAIPRVAPSLWPMFGMEIEGHVWVLATKEIVEGGQVEYCTEPMVIKSTDARKAGEHVHLQPSKGVKAAEDIVYVGHFPVVDMEYQTDAPVNVSLRSWAPFLPGDAVTSNTPAAVFEIHLVNPGDIPRIGQLVMNFAGPSAQEAMSGQFLRTSINEGNLQGVHVCAMGSDVNYFLGVLDEDARTGAGMNRKPSSWAELAHHRLPQIDMTERDGGIQVSLTADASLAVDFCLAPGEARVCRFILAWYAPYILGAEKEGTSLERLKNRPGPYHNTYSCMYAMRFRSALEVAYLAAENHEDWLRRIIAWQEVIYREESIPSWLREQLVNSLHLIPEDSYWVQPRPPIGDWAFPGGLFGMNESSRGCSHTSCIPCDFYGTAPLIYFFPDLVLTTMRCFREYQTEDGNIPFELGQCWGLPDFATPTYEWQKSLNGSCYILLVDRIWQRTQNDAVLDEFYDSLKKCNSYVMGLNTGYGGPISMPTDGPKSEWFEFGEWDGMCAHMGGVRLAQLQVMERMASRQGDEEYAVRCRAWFQEGSQAMETDLWTGSYYLNFYSKESGKKSDVVMGPHVIGQWISAHHGFDGVFDHDHCQIALETVKEVNAKLPILFGPVNFANLEGDAAADTDNKVMYYGAYITFCSEVMMLAMVYMQYGQAEWGLKLLYDLCYNNTIRHGHAWDAPCFINCETGAVNSGTDYYQYLMLWSLPAALQNTSLAGSSAHGGFVEKIMQAAMGTAQKRRNQSSGAIYAVPPTQEI